jgi:hypothetical protein
MKGQAITAHVRNHKAQINVTHELKIPLDKIIAFPQPQRRNMYTDHGTLARLNSSRLRLNERALTLKVGV